MSHIWFEFFAATCFEKVYPLITIFSCRKNISSKEMQAIAVRG